jgi:hypothetical protein
MVFPLDLETILRYNKDTLKYTHFFIPGTGGACMVISALIPKLFSNKLKIAAGIFAAGSVVGSALEIPPVTAYLELLAPSAVTVTDPPAETSASADVPDTEAPVLPAPVPETPAVPEKAPEQIPETPYVPVPEEPAVQETPDREWDWNWESVPATPSVPAEPDVPEAPEVPVYDEYPDWMEGLFVPADPLPAPEENDWMDTPAWENPDSADTGSVPEDTQSSSMTEELAGMLENIAVFWSTADNKIHLEPTCTSGTLFAGTIEEAQTVRTDGWCRRCAEHLDGTSNEVFYIKGNAFAVTESLLDCYSFSDYLRKSPSDAFGG